MIPASNINIKPVVYLKDTDGNYVLDTNNKKIIEKIGTEVSPYDEYEYQVLITEYFGNDLFTDEQKEIIKDTIQAEILEQQKVNPKGTKTSPN